MPKPSPDPGLVSPSKNTAPSQSAVLPTARPSAVLTATQWEECPPALRSAALPLLPGHPCRGSLLADTSLLYSLSALREEVVGSSIGKLGPVALSVSVSGPYVPMALCQAPLGRTSETPRIPASLWRESKPGPEARPQLRLEARLPEGCPTCSHHASYNSSS